jgi:mono/diheme cytochrome c family protein
LDLVKTGQARGRRPHTAIAIALLLLLAPRADPVAASDAAAQEVYREKCASCHGDRRYGGYASPLIPRVLGRKSDQTLLQSILQGLPSTQMPHFGQEVDADQARALVKLIREPVEEITWGMEDIASSHLEPPIEEARIPAAVDRENLILVVERGTQSVSVLDGDSMKELDRFEVGQIHGGIKFDRELRRAFASTRDGTVVKYDLERGGLSAKAKVAVNTRNIAVSPDGRFVAVANQLPASLVVLDGDLRPVGIFPLEGQPSAVYQLPSAKRFLVTLRDAPLLFTLDYPDLAMHSVELPEPFEDMSFVPGKRQLVASSRGGKQLILYDLEQKRVLATLPTTGLPHLFSACFFSRNGALYAAFNHVGVPRLSVVEMESFRLEREIPLTGPGFFARTHSGSPYLWVDTNTEEIQLVAKDSLLPLPRSLVPEPGKKAMHVEFTARGDRALVSIWDPVGAVVVYDSKSLEVLARIPYAMPVGKYNAHNKTRLLH